MSNITNKDIEYQAYSLSDIHVIELLIKFRYKYDENMYLGYESTLMTVNGVSPINQEVVATYSSLDQLIRKCNFNDNQIKIMRMIGEGYTYEDIAGAIGAMHSAIPKRLKTIYKKIAKQNEWDWRKVNYKTKLELIEKQCSKCKEKLPATEEFFRADDRNKDGLQSRCKNCEK